MLSACSSPQSSRSNPASCDPNAALQRTLLNFLRCPSHCDEAASSLSDFSARRSARPEDGSKTTSSSLLGDTVAADAAPGARGGAGGEPACNSLASPTLRASNSHNTLAPPPARSPARMGWHGPMARGGEGGAGEREGGRSIEGKGGGGGKNEPSGEHAAATASLGRAGKRNMSARFSALWSMPDVAAISTPSTCSQSSPILAPLPDAVAANLAAVGVEIARCAGGRGCVVSDEDDAGGSQGSAAAGSRSIASSLSWQGLRQRVRKATSYARKTRHIMQRSARVPAGGREAATPSAVAPASNALVTEGLLAVRGSGAAAAAAAGRDGGDGDSPILTAMHTGDGAISERAARVTTTLGHFARRNVEGEGDLSGTMLAGSTVKAGAWRYSAEDTDAIESMFAHIESHRAMLADGGPVQKHKTYYDTGREPLGGAI
jgi:hypothetical protein